MSGRNLGKSQLNKDNQTFTYISLAVSVILAIFFYYCLFSHSIENAPETTGEIFISEGQASEVDKDTSFIGFLFDYFGSVSYLFPLVIIHLGVLIPHIDFNIRRLNLFKAGLYILGFDCAILGLTSVYSNLFSRGTTGGGGVLGDFFSLEGASYFSSSLTVWDWIQPPDSKTKASPTCMLFSMKELLTVWDKAQAVRLPVNMAALHKR